MFDHTTGSAVSTWFYLVELAVLVVRTWLNFLLFNSTTAHLVKALLLADLLVKLARSRRLAPLPHLGVHILDAIGVTVQRDDDDDDDDDVQRCTKLLPH